MSRHIPFHTRPLDPIYIEARPNRMPPAPSLWLWLLLVIPFWWIVAWVAL